MGPEVLHVRGQRTHRQLMSETQPRDSNLSQRKGVHLEGETLQIQVSCPYACSVFSGNSRNMPGEGPVLSSVVSWCLFYFIWSLLWENSVARSSAVHVDGSGPSPLTLSGLVPSASLGGSQVEWGHHGHLSPSLRTRTSPGWAFLGTEYRGNAAFPTRTCHGSQRWPLS